MDKIDANLEMKLIKAHLARVDLVLQKEIKRWRAAGQDPNDAFRGLYVTDQEVTALLERPLGSNWGDLGDFDNGDNPDSSATLDQI